MGRRKKRSDEDKSSGSSSDSGSEISEKTKTNVLPVYVAKKQKMPGTLLKPPRQPPWYSRRIIEEERPDLTGADGKLNLEREEAALMDMFIRGKSDLLPGDLIITDDNLDEDNRRFNRYEVQLKYNEGRYTALYLISRQICANNETVEKDTLFAMKTSIRPYSVNITLRMKRELRILNELKKAKCPFSPIVLDSGRVADLPFIVMNLLDRNIEKLREQCTAFRPSTAFFIAHECISALAFLHSLKYIHRDVKLTNLCIGAGPMCTRIFLIDYGDTVKKGKKIRYGTPDSYTLPFWSLDAHTRSIARERGDAESWFYVLLDLLSKGCLPWIKMVNETDIEKSKSTAWQDFSALTSGKTMISSQYIHMAYELIRKSRETFDHGLARRIVREALDSTLNGQPLILEWAPNLRVNLPPLEGPKLMNSTSAKRRSARLRKNVVARSIEDSPAMGTDRTSVDASLEDLKRRTISMEGNESDNKPTKGNRRRKKSVDRQGRKIPTRNKSNFDAQQQQTRKKPTKNTKQEPQGKRKRC